MAEVIDMPGNALFEWREAETGSTGMQSWTRVPCGWPDDIRPQAIMVMHGIDVSGRPYVTVDAQEQVTRGKNQGRWDTGRGDMHDREQFFSLLGALIEGGKRAGWL